MFFCLVTTLEVLIKILMTLVLALLVVVKAGSKYIAEYSNSAPMPITVGNPLFVLQTRTKASSCRLVQRGGISNIAFTGLSHRHQRILTQQKCESLLEIRATVQSTIQG